MKALLITFLVTAALIFAASVGICYYRSDLQAKSVVEFSWIISIGFAYVGYLCRTGARTGDTVERTDVVRSTSLNRDGFDDAERDDMNAGVGFGMAVMLSSIAVFGISLAILEFGYP